MEKRSSCLHWIDVRLQFKLWFIPFGWVFVTKQECDFLQTMMLEAGGEGDDDSGAASDVMHFLCHSSFIKGKVGKPQMDCRRLIAHKSLLNGVVAVIYRFFGE